ncbi:MAG: DUF2934 domain-containing protein [Planctomycetaceae bacterium]|nr:DUF2934 domain-containing protein [Planctomycetaceae bacterium]
MTKSTLKDQSGRSTSVDDPIATSNGKTVPPADQEGNVARLSDQQRMNACEDAIRALAYEKWETAGCPTGDGFDFWLEAERELNA